MTITGNYFIGKDGKPYQDARDLERADQAWKKEHYQFIGRDGNFHRDEDLARADQAWVREHLKYMAKDGSFHSDWRDVEIANRAYHDRHDRPLKYDCKNLIPVKILDDLR